MNKNDQNQFLPKKPSSLFGNVVVVLFFFTSLVLSIYGNAIYRLTIIPIQDFVLPVLLAGVVSGTVLTLFKTSWSKWWTFCEGFIGGALFLYFAMLYTNKYSGDKVLTTENFSILEKGTLAKGTRGRCRKPFTTINFHGLEKKLIFTCNYEEQIKAASDIELIYYTGYFGYEVIVSQVPRP